MKKRVKKRLLFHISFKKIFNDFLYAVFGIFEPKPESKKLDIAIGGEEKKSTKVKSSSSEFEIEEKANEEYNKVIDKIEKSTKPDEKQSAKGLKIMTPNQLLTRFPILLAQKKAGNKSQKLNNEIRQIIYCLYSSKNMSKSVYTHFMNIL